MTCHMPKILRPKNLVGGIDHDDIPLLSIAVSNNMNKVWEAIGNKLKGLPEVSALVAGWSSDEDSDDIDVDDTTQHHNSLCITTSNLGPF